MICGSVLYVCICLSGTNMWYLRVCRDSHVGYFVLIENWPDNSTFMHMFGKYATELYQR